MSALFSPQTGRQSTPTCTLVNAHETVEATVNVAALVIFTWKYHIPPHHHHLLLDQSQSCNTQALQLLLRLSLRSLIQSGMIPIVLDDIGGLLSDSIDTADDIATDVVGEDTCVCNPQALDTVDPQLGIDRAAYGAGAA